MINAKDIPNTNITPMVTITEGQLEKINKFTTTAFVQEQLFTFEMLLIDDSVTRNFTLYPESFQRKMLRNPVGGGNWIGLPMLMGRTEDHEAMASNQVGRIFDAKLVKTPRGRIGTLASVYIPVNKSNNALIENIKAGIHKEVSIGVSVEEPTCSICGYDVRECSHEPGETYSEQICHIVMNGKVEGQEVSFVAVPGNLNAKILSDDNGYIPLTEALGKFRKSMRKENSTMAKRNKKLFASKESTNLLKLAKFVESEARAMHKGGGRFSLSDNDDEDNYEEEEEDDYEEEEDEDEDEFDEDDDDEFDEEDDDDDYMDLDEDDDEDDEDEFEEEDEDKNKNDGHVLRVGEQSQAKVYRALEKSLKRIYKSHEALKVEAKDGRKYKQSILKETVRLGALAGAIPISSKEMFRKTFSRMSTKELQDMQKGYKKQVEKLYPSTGKARVSQESIKSSNKKMSISDIVNEFNK